MSKTFIDAPSTVVSFVLADKNLFRDAFAC
jgi:hypothetical protein